MQAVFNATFYVDDVKCPLMWQGSSGNLRELLIIINVVKSHYLIVLFSRIESAVAGLLTAYREGASASTWLVTSDRPAEDITGNISKAYGIMSQGVFS